MNSKSTSTKPVSVTPATAAQLFSAAFNVARDPRSSAYKAGARAALVFCIDGTAITQPHAAGTAEADAFNAGVDEGHAIWHRAVFSEGDAS